MKPLMREPRTWISLAILTVIALHAVPLLSYQGYRQTRWPILVWAMYAKSYPPGPVETERRHLVGITRTARRVEITPWLAGVPLPAMGKKFVRPLLQGDSTRATELFHRLNQNRPDPVVEIRVEQERYAVSDTGLVVDTMPVVSYHTAPLTPR
jgi:hypothetical protein